MSTPGAVSRGRFEVVSPSAGATYSIDPTLRREYQAVPLRAVTPQPTMLTWYVDGQRIGTTSSERSMSWALVVGHHDVEVRDPAGRAARASLLVR
jgi:membrane carboxypeptidase/penicillin-binding protein PbpC